MLFSIMIQKFVQCCVGRAGPGTDLDTEAPPPECSAVDRSLPGVYLANPVILTAAAESGRALPPCGGGVQPGLHPAPSSPNVDTPSQLLFAAPYDYSTTSPMDDTTGTALDSLPRVVDLHPVADNVGVIFFVIPIRDWDPDSDLTDLGMAGRRPVSTPQDPPQAQ